MDWEPRQTMPLQEGVYQSTSGLCPIYGTRTVFMPMRGQWFFQVRVQMFGGLLWINVDERDVIQWDWPKQVQPCDA